jgi:hypothetical protein
MEEMGTLTRNTMAKVYRRLFSRIDFIVEAVDDFH